MKKFEVGKIYEMHSAGDWECVWKYRVVKRTDKSVWLDELDSHGVSNKRFLILKGMSEFRGSESVLPLGSYSMSPVLSAENEVSA